MIVDQELNPFRITYFPFNSLSRDLSSRDDPVVASGSSLPITLAERNASHSRGRHKLVVMLAMLGYVVHLVKAAVEVLLYLFRIFVLRIPVSS
jgi:hypothetical protein